MNHLPTLGTFTRLPGFRWHANDPSNPGQDASVELALEQLRENDDAVYIARLYVAMRPTIAKWTNATNAIASEARNDAITLWSELRKALDSLITQTAEDFDLDRTALPETGVIVDMLGGE